jgi:hypothetical protein
MKKSYTSLTILFLMMFVIAANLPAQTPQYYNANTGGIGNTIPFGSTAVSGYKSQYLIGAGEYLLPTPALAGNITKLYINMASTGGGTYTQLTIKMGQSAITVFPPGVPYTGQLDTVYYNASATLSSTANTWMVITLTKPFLYNPAQSLIIEISHCGFTGTGMSVWQTAGTTGVFRRNNIPGTPSCVFTYSGQDQRIIQNGIDITPVSTTGGPDYLYYKFEYNPNATTVLNCAVPGVGTASAPLGAGTPLSSGGQFDTCITGTGLGTGGVTTGYNFSPGTSSWTISMWITIPSTSSGSAYYLFGDAGNSFRCFHNGVALPDNLVLRGTGVTDVTVTGIGPTPTCVTFVYDSVAANVKAYKNGVLANTVSQTLNITGGTGFKVGGNSTSTSFVGKLDEFRMYHRALTAPEVLQAWNSDLSGCGIVGVQNNNNNTPSAYNLSQNYPNPFNPSTKIEFSLPKDGYVEIDIYDITGRKVSSLVRDPFKAGIYSVEFNAVNLASGIYFYTIKAGDFTATKKMLLIK